MWWVAWAAGLRRAASTWVSPTSRSRTGAAYLQGASRRAGLSRRDAEILLAADVLLLPLERFTVNISKKAGDWMSGRLVSAIGDSGGLSFDVYCCISLLDLGSIWCAFCNKPGQDIHDGDEQSSLKLTRSKYWKA